MSDRDRSEDGEELFVVLETGDATAVTVVSALLESAEIPFVVRGADQSGFDAVIRQAAGLFMKPRGIRVLVSEADRELAEQLLAAAEGPAGWPEELG